MCSTKNKPHKVTFEMVGDLFFDLTEERYPNPEMVEQAIAKRVNLLTHEHRLAIHLKIGLLNAMRDMIREVSPNYLYRSLEHRDELYKAIIEAVEELEDTLEAEEESGHERKPV